MSVAAGKFSIGQFVIDPQAHTIEHSNGRSQRLEAKLILLLCYFADHPASVLSREQLATSVWAGTVVGDEAINRAVFALRNALGDDAKNPQYIETIPKRGYRLIPPVVSVTELQPSKIATEKPSWISTNKFKLIAISLAILFSLAGLTALLLYKTDKRDQHASQWKISDIENVVNTGLRVSNAVPDTQMHKVIYLQENSAGINIWRRSLQGGEALQLTFDDWYKSSINTINDNDIIYLRSKDNIYQIVQQSNSKIKVLYESNKQIFGISRLNNISPYLFFNQMEAIDKVDLYRFNTQTSEIKPLRDIFPNLPMVNGYVSYAEEYNKLYFVSLLADGKVLLELDLKTGSLETITKEISEYRGHFRVGSTLFIAGVKNANGGLWAINLATKQWETLLMATNGESLFLSFYDAANRNLYYEYSQKTSDVWSYTKQGGKRLNINLTGMKEDAFYGNTKDEIYFISNADGFSEFWRYSSISTAKKVTQLKAWSIDSGALSHNKQWSALAYYTDKPNLAIIDLATGEILQHIATEHSYTVLGWSQDDQQVYLVENNSQLYTANLKDLNLTPVDSLPHVTRVQDGTNYHFKVDPMAQPGFTVTLPAEAKITDILNSGDEILVTQSAPPTGNIMRIKFAYDLDSDK